MSARGEALTALLHLQSEWRDPNPERSHVTALEHALQVATRARRARPDDLELVVAALLHDAARPLSDLHHGEVISEILSDIVRPAVRDALWDHGVYQHAILHDLPWPSGSVESRLLATWDSVSFNPDYRPYELDTFLPDLEQVISRGV